jgi:flagellar biosynthesis anti-sigma factor FlgM
MKIDANGPIAAQLQTERSPTQKPDGIATTNLAAAADRTTLNSAGTSVQLLTKQVLESPEIRQDKVDATRQSIGSGAYKVDPAKIADAMVANEHE